jgi:hypothetical protein
VDVDCLQFLYLSWLLLLLFCEVTSVWMWIVFNSCTCPGCCCCYFVRLQGPFPSMRNLCVLFCAMNNTLRV